MKENKLTVPSRVSLGFFKPSRYACEGNSLEDVHVAAVSQADVGSLHQASLCEHSSQLPWRTRPVKRITD